MRTELNRRSFILSSTVAAAGAIAIPKLVSAATEPAIKRAVSSIARQIPVIGMGSWITFNVGQSQRLRKARTEILRAFFDLGGGLVDSSPMYGSSEAVIGHGLKQLKEPTGLYSATKVWTRGREAGIAQMQQSQALWNDRPFDLMQIHNLLDWEVHYETLGEWKNSGRIGAVGITTSHGRRHQELESAITGQPFDFVQFTYNILDREAENRLLPIAAERKIGVILNRPFNRGGLFDHVRGHALPDWAIEFDCHNWAQFFLKFVISHPAVTCAIPATSQVTHMIENMGAARGRLPDEKTRQRMAQYVREL